VQLLSKALNALTDTGRSSQSPRECPLSPLRCLALFHFLPWFPTLIDLIIPIDLQLVLLSPVIWPKIMPPPAPTPQNFPLSQPRLHPHHPRLNPTITSNKTLAKPPLPLARLEHNPLPPCPHVPVQKRPPLRKDRLQEVIHPPL